MSEKRTKSDQLLRNTERLEKLDEVRREPEIADINEMTAEPAATVGIEEPIRRRAYELYQARGGKAGDALQDWLQAEAEIRRRAARTNVIAFPSARK